MNSRTIGAIDALLSAIRDDEDKHGGLLSRDTIRRADELRLLACAERRRAGLPEPVEPEQPRQPRGVL
jgi:hypothetical protein